MTDTRTALINEAMRLLRTRGYSGFSYADLASAVGIRTASIHYHFPTKEDLGVELVSVYSTHVRAALKDIDNSEDRRSMYALERYSELYRVGLTEGLACLYGMYASEVEAIPEQVRDGVARFLVTNVEWLENVVTAGQDSGEIRRDVKASDVAQNILSTCQGAVMVARVNRNNALFDNAIAAMLGSLRVSS